MEEVRRSVALIRQEREALSKAATTPSPSSIVPPPNDEPLSQARSEGSRTMLPSKKSANTPPPPTSSTTVRPIRLPTTLSGAPVGSGVGAVSFPQAARAATPSSTMMIDVDPRRSPAAGSVTFEVGEGFDKTAGSVESVPTLSAASPQAAQTPSSQKQQLGWYDRARLPLGPSEDAAAMPQLLSARFHVDEWMDLITSFIPGGKAGAALNGSASVAGSVGKWAGPLLDRVERACMEDEGTALGGKPNEVVVGTAMFILEKCLEAVGLLREVKPDSSSAQPTVTTGSPGSRVLQHLCTAMYEGGAAGEGSGSSSPIPGSSTLSGGGSRQNQPPPTFTAVTLRQSLHNYLGRKLVFHSRSDALRQASGAVQAQRRLKDLARESLLLRRQAETRSEHSTLRSHFVAWKWQAIRDRAWATLILRRKQKRVLQLRVSRAFTGWRAIVRLSLQGTTLAPSMRKSHRQSTAAVAGRSMRTTATPPPNVGRTVGFTSATFTPGASMLPSLQQADGPSSSVSESDDDESREGSTPSDVLSGSDSENPLTAMVQGPRNEYDPFDPSAAEMPRESNKRTVKEQRRKLRVAKQRYRTAEQAMRALATDKERAMARLTGACEALERCATALQGSRTTSPFSVKAADVVRHAVRLSQGAREPFQTSLAIGPDEVGYPLPVRGDQLLVAWCNFMLERHTDQPAHVADVASAFVDGTFYAQLVEAVFPGSELPEMMRTTPSIPERMELFLRELSRHVVAMERISNASAVAVTERRQQQSAAARRRSSVRRLLPTTSVQPSMTATPSGGSDAPAGPSKGGRSRSIAEVTDATGVSAGGASTGPAAAAPSVAAAGVGGEDASSAVAGSEVQVFGPILAAGVRVQDLLDGSEAAHTIVQYYLLRAYVATVGPDVFGPDNSVEPWMDAPTRAERHCNAIELLSASWRAWGLILEAVEDTVLSATYRVARAERAESIYAAVGRDSTLARFLIPASVSRAFPHHTPQQVKATSSESAVAADDLASTDSKAVFGVDALNATSVSAFGLTASSRRSGGGGSKRGGTKARGQLPGRRRGGPRGRRESLSASMNPDSDAPLGMTADLTSEGSRAASPSGDEGGGEDHAASFRSPITLPIPAEDASAAEDRTPMMSPPTAIGFPPSSAGTAATVKEDGWGFDENDVRLQRVRSMHRVLATIVPIAPEREELLRSTFAFGEMLYGLYQHFSSGAPVLPATGLETLVVECKLVELGAVDRGTGLQLSRRHGRESPGEGLHPMEFTVALIQLSEMAVPTLLSETGRDAKLYASPAARFEFLLAQYIPSRLKLPAPDEVRKLMLGGKLRTTVAFYRRSLQALFGSLAGNASLRRSKARAAALRATLEQAQQQLAASLRGGGGDSLAGSMLQQSPTLGETTSGLPPVFSNEMTLTLPEWTRAVKDLELVDAQTPMSFHQLVFRNSRDVLSAVDVQLPGQLNSSLRPVSPPGMEPIMDRTVSAMAASTTPAADRITDGSGVAVASALSGPMLTYPDFEEAMVAIALARVPNPYMSLATRLHTFFGDRLLPLIRRKFPTLYLRLGHNV